MLEQHVQEHVHRLGFSTTRARLAGSAFEVLVHAVVVDHRNVPCLPVVPDPVVDLVTLAVENVERRLVDVSVFLGLASGAVFLEVVCSVCVIPSSARRSDGCTPVDRR